MDLSPPVAGRSFDLKQLRAALAVREVGTVTRAADALGLSQPAVSRLLAALEAELGFAVFERRAKRLVLSERGRHFLDEGQSAMRSLARLGVVAGELRRGSQGLLRIGAISPLAIGLLARAVAAHRQTWPNLTFELEVIGRQAQLEELRAGRIDIGLAAMPFHGVGLRVEPVLESEATVLLPARHPLARRTVLAPANFLGVPLVLTQSAAIIRQRLDDAFDQAGISQTIAAVVDSTLIAMALVNLGAGIAITHPVPHDTLPPGVVVRRFRPRIPFTYAMVSQADESRSTAIAEFGVTLRRTAQALHRRRS